MRLKDFVDCVENLDSYTAYFDAVIKELEALNFPEFVRKCASQQIGPPQGFGEWIGEATLVVWSYSLKSGSMNRAFFPNNIARSIYEVSEEMYMKEMLTRWEPTEKVAIN